MLNEIQVKGRRRIALRIQLATELTRVLSELAEAEHRSPQEQAAFMLENQLQRLAQADPAARFWPVALEADRLTVAEQGGDHEQTIVS